MELGRSHRGHRLCLRALGHKLHGSYSIARDYIRNPNYPEPEPNKYHKGASGQDTEMPSSNL